VLQLKQGAIWKQEMAQVALNREEFAVSKFLATLKFRRSFFGLEEKSVWNAMERLVSLYEDALTAERGKRELAERKLEALRSREEQKND